MHRYLISICALYLITLAVLSFALTPQAALKSENKSDLPGSRTSSVETNPALNISSISKPMPAFLVAPQLPNRQNIALTSNGGVATASSTTSPSEGLGNYEPLSAINGERAGVGTGASFSNNTFWRDGTEGAFPDWWQVNFQGYKTIDEINVFTMQDNYTSPSEPTEAMTFTQFGIVNFDVQYWNGSAWATVPGGAVTNNNKVWRRFFFSPITTDRIRITVNQALFGRSRLVEVEAWGINALNNLALGKTATQSSTLSTGVPSLAVDGNTGGNFFQNSVTHTQFSANAWWQVDLGGVQSISQIKVWNRTDCCPERLSNFYVFVSDNPFNSTDLTATINQAGVSSYHTPGQGGTPTTLTVGRTGRYVRVQLAGTNYLSLAEVEVIGDVGVNVARSSNGGVASASSVHLSGNFPVAAVNNGDRKAQNWGSGGGWNDNTHGDTSSDIVQINFPAFNFVSEIDVFTLRNNFQDNQTPPTLSETFNACENSGNGITHFEVQYWTGSMWVTIPGGVVRENNNVWRQFVFPEVWASAVRVQVHGAARWTSGNNYSRITEVEAYGRTAGFNLARASNGAVAFASSQFNANYPVSAINDGERTGFNWGRGGFGSGWNDATQNEYSIDWVRVDFAGARRISEIDVYTLRDGFSTKTDDPPLFETFNTADNTGEGMRDYEVQYLSGGVWRTVPGGKVIDNNKVRRQFKFSPITTSAIRVAVNKGANFTAFGNNWSRIVEIEAWETTSVPDDVVWVEDSLPAGAIPAGTWNWTCSNPIPLSGTVAHPSDNIAGIHQHYFYNATQTLTVNTGDTLVAHVFLDPVTPPTQVMLQWNDGTWEHRAYWGQSQIPWGVEGTVSRRNMGVLPPTGQWVRLEVPASLVGLEGRPLNGMAFSLFNGKATWDHAGKVAAGSTSPQPSISISDATVTEGNSDIVNAVFNVTLSSSSTQSITVNYTTVNGTAVHMSDYWGQGGQLSFAPGETLKTITIPVFGDTDIESNETFFVDLSSPVNATIADSQAVGTIVNDDTQPQPGISVSDVSITEGNSGSINAVFNVTLSSSTTQTVTVNYTTVNGTAAHLSDYWGQSGQLSFAPGETLKTISIPVFGDTDIEPNENFFVNLSSPVNATIVDSQGTCTILTDDTGNNPFFVGQWGPLEPLDDVPVHMNLLPDGRILYWGRDKGSDGWDVRNGSWTYTWDPVTKFKKTIRNVDTNLFCAGHSFLPDGRLFVAGGHDKNDPTPQIEGIGDRETNIFDYQADCWELGPPMQNGRWYPSNVTLSNGETAIFTGTYNLNAGTPNNPFTTRNLHPEIFTLQENLQWFADQKSIRIYPYTHLAPNGKVFLTGNQTSWFFDPPANGGAGVFTVPDPDGPDVEHMEGSSVILDSVTGKVMVIAGRKTVGNVTTTLNETSIITLTAQNPMWQFGPPLHYKRQWFNATLLPDGKVLAAGGTQCGGNTLSVACPEGAATIPELWSPTGGPNGSWTDMAENPTRTPRVYHSVALLLPDARVLVGGGGLPGAEGENTGGVERKLFGHKDVEIFSPPYLFNSNGTPATRPVINSAPTSVTLGQTFNVSTSSAFSISSAALMRLATVTHGLNFDQRRVVLTPQATSSSNLSMSVPADGRVCPPGYYMLFIINSSGVPSVAKIIKITSPTPPPPPQTFPLFDVGARMTRNLDGRLQVFYKGPDNAVYYNVQAAPSNSMWSNAVKLDGVVTSNPVAIANADGRLEVFAKGTNNAIYHKWQLTPGSCKWSDWFSLGGSAAGDPAVARNTDGRLQVIYRGGDNLLYTLSQTSPGVNSWSAHTNLFGTLISDPAVTINADGRLEVFAVMTNNGVNHIWQTTAGSSSWSGWFGLGGFTNSVQLAAARNSNGSLQVFFRDAGSGGISFFRQSPGAPGGWIGPIGLGGSVNSDPTVGINADGRLEVFIRATDNTLHHIWQTAPSGSTWSSWFSEGGGLTSGAAPARNADGRLSAIVRGLDNATLYYNAQSPSGGWTGYVALSSNASSF